MKRVILLSAVVLSAMFFSGCTVKPLEDEIDIQKLGEKIYAPTSIEYPKLGERTVLYLDHSTCVIDAVHNSGVFKALRPNLGQYCDTLLLIKGSEFESIPLDRQDNRVSEVLETIKEDIPFADLRKAVFQICNGNQQAILISDCESSANGRFLDLEPYMSEPFRDWISKGHSIYIITEPYQEKYKGKLYDKKRFYFIFSDDKMVAPISNNLLTEIRPLLQNKACSLFKMTNSDIFVQKPKNDLVSEDLTFTVNYTETFDFVSIEDSWDAIREYVMKLDKYGEPLPEEKSQPLIKNLSFNNGENYIVNDIKIVATNITSKYVNIAFDDNSIEVKDIDISDAFVLDTKALQNQKINILLTDKIFTEGYLNNEFGGNLIRLDLVISNVGLKPYDSAIFNWQSLWSVNEAICVSKSIDNALLDVSIIPTCANRRVVHTIFLKTEEYN